MCRNPVEGKSVHEVRIRLIAEEDHLHIAMEDRSQASDVDDPMNFQDLGKATEAELDQLGLYILNKGVQEVTHIRVSGYNCISFKIY